MGVRGLAWVGVAEYEVELAVFSREGFVLESSERDEVGGEMCVASSFDSREDTGDNSVAGSGGFASSSVVTL